MTRPRQHTQRRYGDSERDEAVHGGERASIDLSALMNSRELQEMVRNVFPRQEEPRQVSAVELFAQALRIYSQQVQDDADWGTLNDESSDTESVSLMARRGVQLLQQGIRGQAHLSTDVDMDSDSDDEIDSFTNQLLESLASGRREIPLRHILPHSPPASPVPNFVNTAAAIPFFQRHQQQQQSVRDGQPMSTNATRRPSSLGGNQQQGSSRFADPDGVDEGKSPRGNFSILSPVDRNNDLPLTTEFLHRYGRMTQDVPQDMRDAYVDQPER